MAAVPGARLSTFDSGPLALQELLNGNVEAYVNDLPATLYAIETAELKGIEIAGKPLDLQATTYTGAELLRRLPQPAIRSLTRRETEVLVQVLEGAANKFIARALGISHRTVEIHRSRAMLKLGATSTPELIRRALRQPER